MRVHRITGSIRRWTRSTSSSLAEGSAARGLRRDAAGRARRCYRSKRATFASGSLSASTKLVHGGLRWLWNITSSRWCARAGRAREAVGIPAPDPPAALRAAGEPAGRARSGMLRGLACSSTTIGGRERLPGTDTIRAGPQHPAACRCKPDSRRARVFGTAGSTTRGWWRSMRARCEEARGRRARIRRSPPRAARGSTWTVDTSAGASSPAARWSTAGGPGADEVARIAEPELPKTLGALGAGLAHRGAQATRLSLQATPSSSPTAHLLRDPTSGTSP